MTDRDEYADFFTPRTCWSCRWRPAYGPDRLCKRCDDWMAGND